MKQGLIVFLIVLCNVTAYTASIEECGKNDGITASGTKVVEGRTVACDFLDFGTEVIILGNTYIVEDRIGSESKNKIDIYMEDRKDALNFGRKILEVEIKESQYAAQM